MKLGIVARPSWSLVAVLQRAEPPNFRPLANSSFHTLDSCSCGAPKLQNLSIDTLTVENLDLY